MRKSKMVSIVKSMKSSVGVILSIPLIIQIVFYYSWNIYMGLAITIDVLIFIIPITIIIIYAVLRIRKMKVLILTFILEVLITVIFIQATMSLNNLSYEDPAEFYSFMYYLWIATPIVICYIVLLEIIYLGIMVYQKINKTY